VKARIAPAKVARGCSIFAALLIGRHHHHWPRTFRISTGTWGFHRFRKPCTLCRRLLIDKRDVKERWGIMRWVGETCSCHRRNGANFPSAVAAELSSRSKSKLCVMPTDFVVLLWPIALVAVVYYLLYVFRQPSAAPEAIAAAAPASGSRPPRGADLGQANKVLVRCLGKFVKYT
jgi:hypothetical protein